MRAMPYILVRVLPLALLQAASAQGADFASRWPRGVTRVYAGPDHFANRLYDWRVRDGRVECLEGSKARPMRTLHLLTRACAERPGTLSMRVRTGPLGEGKARHPRTWTGFLIGVGGARVDYRISALCHHWPAADGGLIAALDGSGRLVFRDNTSPEAPKGPRRDIPLSAWPEIEAAERAGAEQPVGARRPQHRRAGAPGEGSQRGVRGSRHEEEALQRVAEAELHARGAGDVVLPHHRHDGARDQRQIVGQIEGNHRLDVGEGALAVERAVAAVIVELDRHADQRGDGIGQLLGQLGVVALALLRRGGGEGNREGGRPGRAERPTSDHGAVSIVAIRSGPAGCAPPPCAAPPAKVNARRRASGRRGSGPSGREPEHA